jgi:hypothetical protein
MTNETFTPVVAVELFEQAIDGMEIYHDRPKGIFMLQDGDVEYQENTDWRGVPYTRIVRNRQLWERLVAMGVREPGYDHFQYMTQEQLDKRVAQLKTQAQQINNMLARLNGEM